MKSHREIEIKLRVPDVQAMRRRLRQLGAIAGRREYEFNTLFDTASAALRKRGMLLRIRRHGGRALITWKEPSQRGRRPASARYKIRSEREWQVSLASAKTLERELMGCGLWPSFIYEKYRTSYRLKGLPGLAVLLDETPVGDFLELEGSRRQIDGAARLLGYAPGDYLTSSYGALYLADCRRKGLQPRHMLFSNRKSRKKSP